MPDLALLHFEPNIFTTIGMLVAIAFLGSKVFQLLRIPQVVGFIVVGVLLGTSFLNLVPLELASQLTFISEIALGLIGFDMGSHLLYRELRTLGRSILFMLFFEAFGAFLLVAAGIYVLTGELHTALVFGAISSATAPAATVEVLAEYDAKGPLTTSLLAVIGLDDALALVLFSVAASLSVSVFAGNGSPSLLQTLSLPVLEIGGSILVGAFVGLLLEYILRHMGSQHDAMAISIAFVFLCVGLSHSLGLSLILTNMVLGAVVVNRDPVHGRAIRFTIEQAGPVIYVLFFALVGARFQVHLLPTMGLMGIAYVLLRSAGKFAGAWIGGSLGKASPPVQRNLGLGLLTQGGVAVGLALESASRFSAYGPEGHAFGALVISVITATTFVVEIIGPVCVKLAIQRAGEIGQARIENDGWASEGAPD